MKIHDQYMSLFDAWHNERMTAEEFHSLQNILRSDGAARRTFLEYASHSTAIREHVGGMTVTNPWVHPPSESQNSGSRKRFLIFGLIFAVLLALGGNFLWEKRKSRRNTALPAAVAPLSVEENASSFKAWREWSTEFRQDDDLLAYYTFEEGSVSDGVVRSQAAFTTADLAISGVATRDGRFEVAEDSSIEFSARKSFARVAIEGEFRSLSLLAWVQVDALDGQFNSLFITDGYDPGEVHWMIKEDGTILFSVLATDGEKRLNFISVSPVVWDRSKSGQWLCLGVALDFATGVVRHYLDGEEIYTESIPDTHSEVITRIGTAEVGNWGNPGRPENPEYAARNLNGKIDEFAIVSRALTNVEFYEFYRAGVSGSIEE